MKKIERYLNIVFFTTFKWCILWGEKFDKYILFERESEVEKLRQKNGFSITEDIDKRIPVNPKFSIDFFHAYFFFGGCVSILLYAICIFIEGLVNVDIILNTDGDIIWISTTIIFLISICVDNYFVFGRDKYKYYFKVFKRLPKQNKKNWGIRTLVSYIIMWFLFWLSLYTRGH